MLKKLVPAVLGALLIAGPVLTVSTAAAADAQTSTMKSHHKAVKHHKKASHHHVMKKHSKAKKTPTKA